MNENNEDVMEAISGEYSPILSEEGYPQDGQSFNQGDTEAKQGNDENMESVSQGDAVLLELSQDDDILEELKSINSRLETMEESQYQSNIGIFEKELDNYNTMEGMLLIIMLFIIAFFIFKLVGGIIKCEKE